MTTAAPSRIPSQSNRQSSVPKFFGDAAGLAEDLRGKIRGEVRFDDGSRALYTTDGSNYREVPIGVVIPRDVEDITNHRDGAEIWRADFVARLRYQSGRPVLQRRGRDGHFEILPRRARDRPAEAARARRFIGS